MKLTDILVENSNQGTQDGHKRELGLYIHIPFCVRKCEYCDFLSAPGTDAMKRKYVEALLAEIESYHGKASGYIVPTIFFGGGTPSCIPESDIMNIMTRLRSTFCIQEEKLEATIEVNPGTITKEKLMSYQKAGINRISFGLQSTDDMELKELGRIHCYEDFLQNYRLAREVGYHNINVDLMSALPGQTVSSWERTLRRIAELEPEHISAYSLIIEEGTGFYERYRPGGPREKELPDEETDRQIYYRTKSVLESYGYSRYEISNYAKASYECRHNNSYWIGTEYLGLGLGAASLLNGTRFSNVDDITLYIKLLDEHRMLREKQRSEGAGNQNINTLNEDMLGIRRDQKQLTQEEQMEEFMFLGLRRWEGINKEIFHRRFGKSIEIIYGDVLLKLEQQKLIESAGDQIRLTEYGIDVSNSVLSEFLLNEL
jgi:oxygen-independent coproporphyrinogen-3 oxidase